MFGIACAGKSYLGELLASEYGFKFYNADAWITQQQLAEYQSNGEFRQDTRDAVHEYIADKIASLDHTQNIVIAQASIKACNRQQIMQRNPNVQMVWVKADLSTLLARAARRQDCIGADYILQMLQNFDEPTDQLVIDNSDSVQPLALAENLQSIMAAVRQDLVTQ